MADHHHHQGSEERGSQCNYKEGTGDSDTKWDQKAEWSFEDWVSAYDHMSTNKAKGPPSAELVQYVEYLLPSEPARVLVPLCGQSPDMRWLYDRGNTVVGLEWVEKPVKEFFDEHSDLQHSVEVLPFGKVYKSADGRLQVFVCDITKVPEGALGQFDAVFDWGSYTAISDGDRQRYVEVVTSTLKEEFRYFLEVCHDAPPGVTYLPNSVSLRTIKVEFGPTRKMQVLATKDISDDWGVDTFFNSFILLTPKDPK